MIFQVDVMMFASLYLLEFRLFAATFRFVFAVFTYAFATAVCVTGITFLVCTRILRRWVEMRTESPVEAKAP